ncbi:MAG: hypothetical protein E3J21_07095 [Anaerolineales bacterium]|nr:MAG: hypothetical protein E3J21_07095 [Anaerolineales bacterium]
MNRVFQAGGAIPPDSPTYVEREADGVALLRVRQMEYVHIIVARQMGKTCLLRRLAAHLEPEGYLPVKIDLSRLAGMEMDQWYKALGGAIVDQIAPDAESSIVDQDSLYKFFIRVAQQRNSAHPIVVTLDEIDSTRLLDFSDGFFSTLRALYNDRADEPALREITFVMVGATDPRHLIKDPGLSPFNVGQEIRLEEFTSAETRRLTDNLALAGISASDDVHERIYGWTSGQPYLTQKVCATLEDWRVRRGTKQATVGLVDQAVQEGVLSAKANDSNLSHIRARLDEPAAFMAKAFLRRIFAGERIRFEPHGGADGRLAELYLIGVIKEGPNGNSVIRNRIYQEALKGFLAREVEMETDVDDLRKQIAIHRKNLSRLEERKARHGLDVPLKLPNEIDLEREEVARLVRALKELGHG